MLICAMFNSAILTNGSSKRSEQRHTNIKPSSLQPYVSIPVMPLLTRNSSRKRVSVWSWTFFHQLPNKTKIHTWPSGSPTTGKTIFHHLPVTSPSCSMTLPGQPNSWLRKNISQTLHFSVLRSHVARCRTLFSPGSTYNNKLTTTFSRPERTKLVDDFESTISGCLCLSLPRSSKSLELVQTLQHCVSRPRFDGFPNEEFIMTKKAAWATLTYIEVSSNVRPWPFYVSVLSDWLIEWLCAALWGFQWAKALSKWW